jgi:hypothetical protein
MNFLSLFLIANIIIPFSSQAFTNRILSTHPQNIIPAGYILVPHMTGYTDKDFYVSKYLMSGQSTIGIASSIASLSAWVNINRDDAVAACKSKGAKYSLINNNQWQTISRDIALRDDNWSGGTSSNGKINTGIGFDDTNSGASAPASVDDNLGCINTLYSGLCDKSTWNERKRTHILSNGRVIWDLAGITSSWVKDDLIDPSPVNGASPVPPGSLISLPSSLNISVKMLNDYYVTITSSGYHANPALLYNYGNSFSCGSGDCGFGQYYSIDYNTSGLSSPYKWSNTFFTRGGNNLGIVNSTFGYPSGIFSLRGYSDQYTTSPTSRFIGFRCVFIP